MTTTADIDSWQPFCRPSWLSAAGHKPILELERELEREVDESNPYMKFGRNLIKNDKVRVTTDRRTDGQTDGWTSQKQ